MEYPKNHRDIVEDLMAGKFLLPSAKYFESLKENEPFYQVFFKESFNYTLSVTNDFAYVISADTQETLSRDISIFFAILCYELDRDGRNFLDLIQYSEFETEEIDRMFENSSFIDLILSNKQLKDGDARRTLLNSMNRRHIIEKITEDRFIFTSAYKVFIEFAIELAKSRSKEVEPSNN
jgi:hypothetical protein